MNLFVANNYSQQADNLQLQSGGKSTKTTDDSTKQVITYSKVGPRRNKKLERKKNNQENKRWRQHTNYTGKKSKKKEILRPRLWQSVSVTSEEPILCFVRDPV